ncbi:tRNA (adenosine(37)-N6)-threonylcarbamoyltransferase complex dimerization subunit type 1 TsaB [Selenomonadales bacterium OttesenSCG-928-I06]|nr:tRNA (adenosine(37)-N6)-threonylcarbamoyltransferase complex dimerization subunit type 1 TsaB [Selenomonadales bacterium OttesenSCG-928-I06]
MPTLAIDTSTLVSSVAVATEFDVLAEINVKVKKTHSERLMAHIKEVIEKSEIPKEKISKIAVSGGPGSFTGLRIGLATAKALAYALNIPIIKVPTLKAMAFSCPIEGSYLVPMLDAQKGNVYQAIYKWDGFSLREISPETVVDFKEAYEKLKKLDMPYIILGEAAHMYAAEIEKPLLGHITMPRAASVAILGARMFKEGIVDDVFTLEPFYIRRSEAEVLFEKRALKGNDCFESS